MNFLKICTEIILFFYVKVKPLFFQLKNYLIYCILCTLLKINLCENLTCLIFSTFSTLFSVSVFFNFSKKKQVKFLNLSYFLISILVDCISIFFFILYFFLLITSTEASNNIIFVFEDLALYLLLQYFMMNNQSTNYLIFF